MLKSRCLSPSCYALAVEGETRCEKHLVKRKKEINKIRNMSRKNAHIYDSKRWRVLRKKYITANPLCEISLKKGIMVAADVVDHIIEINDDPSLAFVWSNLMSLSHAEHNKKTQREKVKRNESKTPTKKRDGLVFG